MTDTQQDAIRYILTHYRTIAAVGFNGRDRTKPAYYTPAYLKGQGFTVIPIGRGLTEGLGRAAYPSLSDAPPGVEVALLFLPPRRVGPAVDEALAIGAKAVWLPIGVVDEEAAARARAAGLWVVMDRCMMVEHKYLDL